MCLKSNVIYLKKVVTIYDNLYINETLCFNSWYD